MGKLLDDLRKKHAASPPKASRHALGFLVHKDDIAEAMREGWTAKQIWEHMVEENMTTMSYASFCRHVRMKIMANQGNAGDANPIIDKPISSPVQRKAHPESFVKKPSPPARELSEKERLDLLREEAFNAVRSRKPTGPLIARPKTREEELKELFGKGD